MTAADTTPAAVQLRHDLLVWLIPLLDQFPRARRFTLGERLEREQLAVRTEEPALGQPQQEHRRQSEQHPRLSSRPPA